MATPSGSCCGNSGSCGGSCNRMYPSQTQLIDIPANFATSESLYIILPYCTASNCDNLALTADDFTFVGLCLRQRSTGYINIINVNNADNVLPNPPDNSAFFMVSVVNITPSHITLRIQWGTQPTAPYNLGAVGTLCLEYWAACPVESTGCCPDPQVV